MGERERTIASGAAGRGGAAEGAAVELGALVEFQIGHSAWALRELIACAGRLEAGAAERDLGIGPGSLRENLAHTIECMFFFADNFAGREYVEPREFAAWSGTVEGLGRLLTMAEGALRGAMAGALARGGERVSWPNAPGGTLPAAAAVAQVFDHSTLHRAQCVNMLRRLGVVPVPDLDPLTYESLGKAGEWAGC
jgi:uncharacterized damage-inducible protein DinB